MHDTKKMRKQQQCIGLIDGYSNMFLQGKKIMNRDTQ